MSQHSQQKNLEIFTNSYRCVTNDELPNELAIKWVSEVIQEYVVKYENKII